MNRAASIFKVFHFSQKGASIIAVIAIMLILAVMGAALVSLVTTGSDVSVNQLQSEQAFYVAEGGKEYILANRTFPNYSTGGGTTNLGGIGSTVSNFKVDTPTYLTVAVAIGNTTITVNDTSKFATAPGSIVIDSEVMAYTAKTATTFTVAAATASHVNGNAVYPVTTANPIAVDDLTITVASTVGFVIPGVIKIDSEYIYCTALTATTFTNCTRGYKGTTAASHIVGSNVYQYTITSTGTVGNAQRVVKTDADGISGAIAFDASPSPATGNNVNSLTWSHTVGAGSNRILIVGVSIRNNSSQTVSSVTYGGIALTSIGAVNNATNVRLEMWYLVAPVTGTNNIVVTLSASARFVGGSVSFIDVNQATPIDTAFVSATGNSNTPSVNITTVTNNAWVVDTVAVLQNITLTVGAGQTQMWNTSVAAGGNRVNGAGSTEGPKTPAGLVRMSWNITAGGPEPWAIGAVALKPATTGVSVLTWQEKY